LAARARALGLAISRGDRLYLRPNLNSRRPALRFILITITIDILGIGLIIPILPRLVESLGGGGVESALGTVGLLGSLYSVMQFLCAPFLGSLSDRFGRRPVILVSLLGSGLDYFLLAFAPTLAWFFVGRMIVGMTAANFAVAGSYIADISPPEKRAANFGLIGGAFGVGFVLGPALGGLLGNVGLRVPFLVAGVLTLLNCWYGWRVLPESLAPENRRAFSWRRSNPVGALRALRRYPMVLGLMLTFFVIQLAHQVLPNTWVLYTQYRYGWTAGQTGISLAIVGAMAALVQGGLTGRIVGCLGEQKAALLGLGVGALGYLGYGLATKGWMVCVILVVASVSGVIDPALKAMISRGVGDDEQGGVHGALASLGSMAGIIGPLMTTQVFAYFIGASAPMYLPGAAFFLSAPLMAGSLLVRLPGQ
jgi:MFS transporter, DHA1 family, tetracycline resistance protein